MKNHDKWPNVTLVQLFCKGVDHANLVSSFHGSKYLPKIRFSIKCAFFFKYKHLKRFVIKAYKRARFPNWW